MRKSHAALPGTQRGATLVIALLILVMIMMYGIPAAMNSTQNERMAGNTRNRDLAFQAAEHAIKKAETWIYTQTATSLDPLAPVSTTCPSGNTDPNTADCVFPDGQCHANDVAYWQAYNWAASNVCTFTGSDRIDSALVDVQPRYIVERMPVVQFCQPNPTLLSTDPACPMGSSVFYKHYYRVTAMGVGKDSSAVVILQAMYQFP